MCPHSSISSIDPDAGRTATERELTLESDRLELRWRRTDGVWRLDRTRVETLDDSRGAERTAGSDGEMPEGDRAKHGLERPRELSEPVGVYTLLRSRSAPDRRDVERGAAGESVEFYPSAATEFDDANAVRFEAKLEAGRLVAT